MRCQLTRAECEHFLDKGFVVVKGAFPRTVADEVCETAWAALAEQGILRDMCIAESSCTSSLLTGRSQEQPCPELPRHASLCPPRPQIGVPLAAALYLSRSVRRMATAWRYSRANRARHCVSENSSTV